MKDKCELEEIDVKKVCENEPISKDLFLELYDEDISKKRYSNIISIVEERITYIIYKIHGKSMRWYIFPNGSHDVENCGGNFEPDEESKEWIELSTYGHKKIFEHYSEGFPTKWLWTENKEIVSQLEKEKNNLKIEKEIKIKKNKEKTLDLKQKKSKFKEIISSKLTEEELKYIKFK